MLLATRGQVLFLANDARLLKSALNTDAKPSSTAVSYAAGSVETTSLFESHAIETFGFQFREIFVR